MRRSFLLDERIERPRDVVWRFMTDAGHAHAWVRGVGHIEPLTKRTRVGSRFRERTEDGAPGREQELLVTAYEPPRRFAAALVTTGGRLLYEYRLRAEGQGATRVSFQVRAEPATLRGRLYLAHGLQAVRRRDADHLARLKAAIEGQVPPADWVSPLRRRRAPPAPSARSKGPKRARRPRLTA